MMFSLLLSTILTLGAVTLSAGEGDDFQKCLGLSSVGGSAPDKSGSPLRQVDGEPPEGKFYSDVKTVKLAAD